MTALERSEFPQTLRAVASHKNLHGASCTSPEASEVSSIPPLMARRLDRLARRAHAYHRFAHHPSCVAYRGEVFRLGRRGRVCRGCTLSVAGAAAGAGAALALPTAHAAAGILFAVASLCAALLCLAALIPPRLRRGGPRLGKAYTRALPLALAAALAVAGLRTHRFAGIVMAVAVGACALTLAGRYRRRGPDRTPCLSCPERTLPATCSGFRDVARREAAFGRMAARLLQDLPPPTLLRSASLPGASPEHERSPRSRRTTGPASEGGEERRATSLSEPVP